MINETYEDYLKAIYIIAKNKKGAWVSNSEISDFLNIRPSSVSGMLHHLKNKNYITWTPRSSLRLTTKGKNIADLMVIKSKKLREFFTEVLKLENKELIDNLCCSIEHHITIEVVEALENLIAQN